MTSSSFSIVLVLISISIITQVSSLKCYICDANTDNDCKKNLKQSFIEECKPNEKHKGIDATGCASMISQLGGNSTLINVIRGCYYADLSLQPKLSEGYGCDEIITNQFIPFNCSLCKEDLCNHQPINGCIKFGQFTIVSELITLFIIIQSRLI